MDGLVAPAQIMAPTDAAFGMFLVERGLLTPATLDRARRLQDESGERFGAVLTKLGLVSEHALAEALAAYAKVPLIALGDFPATPILPEQLSRKFLQQAMVVPVSFDGHELVLAVADPLDRVAIDAIAYALDCYVTCRVATLSDLFKALQRLYGDSASERTALALKLGEIGPDQDTRDSERLKDLASEAPIIRLVNGWIDRAVETRASDIHIEASETLLRIRYRVDGALRTIDELPGHLGPAVSSRIKVMARLDIAERRLPQDGKFRVAVRGKDIDFRISVIPSIHGESLVLRILDRDQVALDFATLGYGDALLARYLAVLQRPHGILLVTGPTGSGKTTTLYASLLKIRTPDIKILTVEDPVEYQIDDINQMQVQPQIGLTFAGALRSFLRHDPDVILVGEIRDAETARIAVQAALTGHLVLSTLHTNDAASAITRLLDMGVDDYLIASTVNGIAAQRLVRKLCPACRVPVALTDEVARRFGFEPVSGAVLYKPGGCAQCGDSGYRGRTTVAEVLPITDPIRQLILKHAATATIQRQAEAEGMETMYRNGLRKCRDGLTTIDEILRVTAKD